MDYEHIDEKAVVAEAEEANKKLVARYEELTREFGGVNNMGLPTYIEVMERFAENPMTSGPSFGYNGEICAQRALFYREMMLRNYHTVGDVLNALATRAFDAKEVHGWIQGDMLQGFEEPLVRKGYPEFTRMLETHAFDSSDEDYTPPSAPDEPNPYH